MTLLLWCSLCYTQTILKHEKKIDIAQKYLSREINFINATDNVLLSGTFLEPTNDYQKIVIIIPGSGKDTRHSHHKLTEELLQKNIAVYRFDDRGVGKSEGFYSSSIHHLTSDILSASQKIKSLYKSKKIGLLSHRLGGIATIIAKNQSSNQNIDFLIQIATPVTNFSKTTQYQIQTLPYYKVKNLSILETQNLFLNLLKIVRDNSSLTVAHIQEKGYDYLKSKNIDLNQIKFWSRTHIDLYQYELKEYYKNLKVPTMYLIGFDDKYINAKEETTSLKSIQNSKVTIKVFSDLDHYLTNNKEHKKNMYAIDKKATNSIIKWIDKI